jgi:hypothetical protein
LIVFAFLGGGRGNHGVLFCLYQFNDYFASYLEGLVSWFHTFDPNQKKCQNDCKMLGLFVLVYCDVCAVESKYIFRPVLPVDDLRACHNTQIKYDLFSNLQCRCSVFLQKSIELSLSGFR